MIIDDDSSHNMETYLEVCIFELYLSLYIGEEERDKGFEMRRRETRRVKETMMTMKEGGRGRCFLNRKKKKKRCG